jgi:hypothetical protein
MGRLQDIRGKKYSERHAPLPAVEPREPNYCLVTQARIFRMIIETPYDRRGNNVPLRRTSTVHPAPPLSRLLAFRLNRKVP